MEKMKMLQRLFSIFAAGLVFTLLSGCVSQPFYASGGSTADYTEMAWDALEAENLDRAIDYSGRAINQNKKLAESYLVRGIAYYRKEDYNRAIQELSMSIKVESYNDLPYYFRAEAYCNIGNFNQGRKDYEAALKHLVVFDDFSENLYHELVEVLDILKDMFWAWEWSGPDPVEKDTSYTFVFMEDRTGNYTVYRNGRQVGNQMRFEWDESFITVELSNGSHKQYPFLEPVNDGEHVVTAQFIIDNWNGSGKKLILHSDFTGD